MKASVGGIGGTDYDRLAEESNMKNDQQRANIGYKAKLVKFPD